MSEHELYADLVRQAAALTEGEPNILANLSNLAALLGSTLPRSTGRGFT